MKQQAIGIIDSGIGGFTVAHSVRQLLPHEDIIYLGDGANAPYGNRSEEQLIALAQYMVDFMNAQQVKLLLVACNTISCLASFYQSRIACPVLYVVESGARGVGNYKNVGVISTQFTHKKGIYAQSIQKIAPHTMVHSQGSTHLVQLIESHRGDPSSDRAILQELETVISPLVAQKIDCLVFGCTHYPLVRDHCMSLFPQLPLSDPAVTMAEEAKTLLTENQELNNDGGALRVYTTGDVSLQEPHLKRAKLFPVTSISHYPPFPL